MGSSGSRGSRLGLGGKNLSCRTLALSAGVVAIDPSGAVRLGMREEEEEALGLRAYLAACQMLPRGSSDMYSRQCSRFARRIAE
jgi:hypothetical protein